MPASCACLICFTSNCTFGFCTTITSGLSAIAPSNACTNAVLFQAGSFTEYFILERSASVRMTYSQVSISGAPSVIGRKAMVLP